jgi:hypothetical protein
MITISPNPSASVKTPTPESIITTTLLPRVTSAASTSEVTINDLVFTRNAGATVFNDARIVAEGEFFSRPNPFVEFESENGLATVAEDGRVTSLSNSGTASILVKTPFVRKRVTFPAGGVGSVADVYTRYANGSLGKELFDEVTTALGNYSSGSSVFTSRNDTTGAYVRATNFANLDLTGWSVWTSSHGTARSAVAISRRHVLLANHYRPSNGATIRFVTAANEVVERTLSSSAQVLTSDIRIGTLNADLPESIVSYPVLPVGWEDRLTELRNIPILYTKANLIYPRDWTYSASYFDPTYYPTVFGLTSVGTWASISQNVVGGDSSKPIFTLINGQTVLLGVNWQQVFSNGANAPLIGGRWTDLVEAIMDPYELTTVDLSGFNNYG